MADQGWQAEKIRKEFKDKAGKETRKRDPDATRTERKQTPARDGAPDVREGLRQQADDNTR